MILQESSVSYTLCQVNFIPFGAGYDGFGQNDLKSGSRVKFVSILSYWGLRSHPLPRIMVCEVKYKMALVDICTVITRSILY